MNKIVSSLKEASPKREKKYYPVNEQIISEDYLMREKSKKKIQIEDIQLNENFENEKEWDTFIPNTKINV